MPLGLDCATRPDGGRYVDSALLQLGWIVIRVAKMPGKVVVDPTAIPVGDVGSAAPSIHH